jgi:DNA-binding transcriptional LysR family regulator
MDRLRVIEVFARVVESGSFSAAARDLGIGQPAVSKIIAALEERLRVRLLARSTRRVTPTEAGVAFYERAVRALTEANEADAAAQGLGAGLEGRLRVCAPVTFARLHLVPKLGRFLEANPRLRFEMIMDDRTVNLLEEGVDVAAHLGTLTDSALTARKIAQAERVVVASPSYLARRGTPRAPTDLLKHAAIIYGQRSGGDEWVFRRGRSEVSVRIRGVLTLSAAEGVRAAVIAGQGFAIASRWMFAPELESGEVVTLVPKWRLPPMDLWVVYPAGRLTSTKARAFVKWFETTIK